LLDEGFLPTPCTYPFCNVELMSSRFLFEPTILT
jgi:hypothetical protein